MKRWNRIMGACVLACVLCHGIALSDDSAESRSMCHAATCRVRVGNSLGSGTFVKATQTHCYVLTNAHVTGQQLGVSAEIEIWLDGHQSQPIPSEVVAIGFIPAGYRDLAMIRVDRRRLAGYLPPIIPIAPERYTPTYRRIYTVGCAGGRWPTALEGFGVDVDEKPGSVLKFKPAPAGGRSGSGIFDLSQDRPMLIGLLTWRNSQEPHDTDGRGETSGYGLAQTHWEILAGLRGDRPPHGQAWISPEGFAVCQVRRGQVMRPPIPQPQQAAEPPGPQTQGTEEPAAQMHRPVKPDIPETSKATGDVVLLVSDPVAVGPDTVPAQTSGYDVNCPGGQCPPQNPYAPQEPRGNNNGNRLFPSLPYLDEEPEKAPTPAPSAPRDRTALQWIPWAVLGAVLLVQVAVVMRRVFQAQLAAAIAAANKTTPGL